MVQKNIPIKKGKLVTPLPNEYEGKNIFVDPTQNLEEVLIYSFPFPGELHSTKWTQITFGVCADISNRDCPETYQVPTECIIWEG